MQIDHQRYSAICVENGMEIEFKFIQQFLPKIIYCRGIFKLIPRTVANIECIACARKHFILGVRNELSLNLFSFWWTRFFDRSTPLNVNNTKGRRKYVEKNGKMHKINVEVTFTMTQ